MQDAQRTILRYWHVVRRNARSHLPVWGARPTCRRLDDPEILLAQGSLWIIGAAAIWFVVRHL